MKTVIAVVVLAVIIGAAVWYIYRSKKRGRKCIGCPDSGCCSSGGCAGCSGCGNHN